MNDPWKDIRATHFYHRDDLDVFSYEVTTAELNRLLADADALLALAKACIPLYEVLTLPWLQEAVTKEERLILEAFRALPLYLQKGE